MSNNKISLFRVFNIGLYDLIAFNKEKYYVKKKKYIDLLGDIFIDLTRIYPQNKIITTPLRKWVHYMWPIRYTNSLYNTKQVDKKMRSNHLLPPIFRIIWFNFFFFFIVVLPDFWEDCLCSAFPPSHHVLSINNQYAEYVHAYICHSAR